LLSSGEAGDAPKGRELLEKMGHQDEVLALLMDKAYESEETRALAVSLGYKPVVAQKQPHLTLGYGKELYKKLREVGHFFAYTSVFGEFVLVPDAYL
jgi:hypothetical protein